MERPNRLQGSRVVAVVPAHDEGDRVAETVRALRRIGAVDHVVVVDDGSSDATASAALTAGATVIRIPRRVGKGRALEGALLRLPPADVWLLADADLGPAASRLEGLLQEVLAGRTDVAIAALPPQPGGGFGLVKRAAGTAIRLLGGFEPRAPLSGQRAVTHEALRVCRPLAPGFGVETAMTIDVLRRGFRVAEVPVDLTHRPTSRDLRGFLHRGRQGLDIARAVAVRAMGLR